jgi:hypothetical protein
MNGRQAGDPANLGRALVAIAKPGATAAPLTRDAVGIAEQKAKDLLEQADAHRTLSTSLAHDDAE